MNAFIRPLAEISQQATEILVREIEEGVRQTGVRAGFIGEIGTGRQYVRPAEERVFRAAALAHQKTGVAITSLGPSGVAYLSGFPSFTR